MADFKRMLSNFFKRNRYSDQSKKDLIQALKNAGTSLTLTGTKSTAVSGSPGSDGNVAKWDSNGDLIGAGTNPPSSTGETTGFSQGAGLSVNHESTFTGNVGSTAYNISDIVKHLKNQGLIEK
jgi:hypothetical protein